MRSSARVAFCTEAVERPGGHAQRGHRWVASMIYAQSSEAMGGMYGIPGTPIALRARPPSHVICNAQEPILCYVPQTPTFQGYGCGLSSRMAASLCAVSPTLSQPQASTPSQTMGQTTCCSPKIFRSSYRRALAGGLTASTSNANARSHYNCRSRLRLRKSRWAGDMAHCKGIKRRTATPMRLSLL